MKVTWHVSSLICVSHGRMINGLRHPVTSDPQENIHCLRFSSQWSSFFIDFFEFLVLLYCFRSFTWHDHNGLNACEIFYCAVSQTGLASQRSSSLTRMYEEIASVRVSSAACVVMQRETLQVSQAMGPRREEMMQVRSHWLQNACGICNPPRKRTMHGERRKREKMVGKSADLFSFDVYCRCFRWTSSTSYKLFRRNWMFSFLSFFVNM